MTKTFEDVGALKAKHRRFIHMDKLVVSPPGGLLSYELGGWRLVNLQCFNQRRDKRIRIYGSGASAGPSGDGSNH